MKKEEITEAIGRPLLNPLKNLFCLGLLSLISSPFIWIWIGFILAFKIFISSIIFILIVVISYKFVEKCVKETIEEEMKKEQPSTGKSKFMEKLDKVMEQQKQAKEQ